MAEKFYSNAYAVLIGVNDYSAFDRSNQGVAAEPAQLAGSLNDVAAWWRVCLDSGFDPARIRVLVSPGAPGEMDGAPPYQHVDAATRDKILEATEWIAQMLERNQGAIGFMSFSGHGDVEDGQWLTICPSDTERAPAGATPSLLNAISTKDLQAIIDRHKAGENLTVVLDCCYSAAADGTTHGGAPGRRKLLSLTGRSFSIAAPGSPGAALGTGVPRPAISERVISASEIGHPAYQAKFAGRWNGAFTWALTSALSEWRATREGEVMRLDVSYGTACTTAGALLGALSFRQRPQLHPQDDPARLAVLQKLAFFHPGDVGHPNETSLTPDGWRMKGQMDPTEQWCRYQFALPSVSGFVQCVSLAVRVDGVNMVPQREYWRLPGDFLTKASAPQPNDTMTVAMFTGTDAAFPGPDYPSGFYTYNVTLWDPIDGPRGDTLFFCQNSDGSWLGMAFTPPDEHKNATGLPTFYVGVPQTTAPPVYAIGPTSQTFIDKKITFTAQSTSQFLALHPGLYWRVSYVDQIQPVAPGA